MNSVGIMCRYSNQNRKTKMTFLFCAFIAFIIGVLIHIPAVTGYLFPVTNSNIAGRCISAILFLICMAFSVTYICILFEIKSTWLMLLASFLLLSSPWITLNISDYNCGELKALAFFLATLSAYIVLCREKRNHKLIALGMGVVGALLSDIFINVFLVIVILHMIYRVVVKEGGKDKISADVGWILAVLFVSCVASLALGLYQGRVMALLPNMENSFAIFTAYYFKQDFLNNAWRKRKLVHVVLFLLLGALIIFSMLVKKSSWRRITIILTLAFCPIAMCGFQIFVPLEPISLRTLPAMNMIYILLLAIVSTHMVPKRADFPIAWCTWICLGYMAYILVLYGQIYQSTLQINHVKLYALADRITTQISEINDDESRPVLIYGNMRYGNYPDQYAQELAGYILTGALKPDLFSENPKMATKEWIDYLHQYHRIQYKAPDEECLNDIIQKEEFTQMPYFPESGAVKIVNDTVVVKLSD